MGDRIFNQNQRNPKKGRTQSWYDIQACLVNLLLSSGEWFYSPYNDLTLDPW